MECSLCGSRISLAREHAYALSEIDALCFACAVCRGGTYDEALGSWTSLPALNGLHVEDPSAPRSERPFSSRPYRVAGSRLAPMPLQGRRDDD